MNNNPTVTASMELVKALEELTKTTGVRIDLSPLQDKPKPQLRIVEEVAALIDMHAEDDDDGA